MISNSSKDAVTIVSGVPRSGTSLVMQMLDSGGLEILQDKIRMADDDNPKGYFEYEPVKHLKTDNTWVASAKGKAIKVIYAMLPYLPLSLHYNVLYVMRDLDEVIKSQATMLNRVGKRGAGTDPESLKAIFKKEIDKNIRYISTQPNFRMLVLQHHDLVADPAEEAGKINTFLGGSLIEHAMIKVVDPSLYRNKSR